MENAVDLKQYNVTVQTFNPDAKGEAPQNLRATGGQP